MRITAGPADRISATTCSAIGDGDAIVMRVDGEIVAFRNRCLHQDSPLDGGWIRNGILSCPRHFWRYRVHDGTHLAGDGRLERFDVETVDGEVIVTLPDPAPARSLRDQLLDRARHYDRDRAHRDETTGSR